MTTARRRALAGASALVLMTLGGGCVGTGNSPICASGDESWAFDDAIEALPDGAQVPVADLTAFDWDHVWYFAGTDDLSSMREAMGVDNLGRDFTGRAACAFHGLYFVQGSEVVRVLTWGDKEYSMIFGARGEVWGNDVRFAKSGTAARLCAPADCPPESTD